jgi:hypothetical protein
MTYYSSLEEAYQIPLKKKVQKEHFENGEKKNPTRQDMLGEREKVSYRSQLTDYDYICNTTGVCPLEEFNTKEAQKRCEPLQPPKYEYPLSDKDKEKFKQALKVALEEMESGPKTKETEPKPKVEMEKVSGFIDEELETYMKLKDIKPVKIEKPPIDERLLKDIPGKETTLLEPAALPKPPPACYTKDNKNWLNLLLFIGSGILVIFLLEQLYKLALLTGLKKTVLAMEYIIREAKANNQSISS